MKDKIKNITRDELTQVINSTVELPAELRETIKLYLSGLSVDEVARELSLPVSTVRNRLNLAKVFLNTITNEQDI